MIHEIIHFFGLTKQLQNVEFFETEESKKICKEIQTFIETNNQLIALTGIIGSGKTSICENIRKNAQTERKILFSTSWAVEKNKVKLSTLMTALFEDLVLDKHFKVPSQAEKRERRLCELIKKRRKPIALMIDEAHDLHSKTLFGLKRLIEIVTQNEGRLSILLVGLPKLAVTLKNPAFEEIGTRVQKLSLDIIAGRKREFIEWMLDKCSKPKIKPSDIFSEKAIELLADKLRTPLQIIYYAWQALDVSYQAGMKPISIETVRKVLAPDLNDLEATLIRQGFSEKVLREMLDLKRGEIRAFLRGKLPLNRTEEIHGQLLHLGVLKTA